MDIRFQYSGDHTTIYLQIEQDGQFKDQEVSFHAYKKVLVCRSEEGRLGEVKRFEDQSFVQSLLDSQDYYRAFLTDFNQDRTSAVITIYQPREFIKEIRCFFINNSEFGIADHFLETYLLEHNLLMIDFDSQNNRYLLFGKNYQIAVLQWQNDQLIIQKEFKKISIKEYERQIKNALLFQTNVQFTSDVPVDAVDYEMRDFPPIFTRTFLYLEEWQKYMVYEKTLLEDQIKACKPLNYNNSRFIKDGVRFFIDSDADLEAWELAQNSLIIEVRFKQGKKTRVRSLGRILNLTSTTIDVEWNEEDSVEALEIRGQGQLTVNQNANDTAMKRRKRALDKVLQRKSILKDLREILSENDYVKDITQYQAHFPSVSVPTLINGFHPDPIQKRAIESALNTNDISLIQGPPGTGKTSVIQTIMKCLMEQGKDKILLTSYQHLAVDNAMEGLIENDFLTYRYGGSDYESKTEREYQALTNGIVDRITESWPEIANATEQSEEQLIKEEILEILEKNNLTHEAVERLETIIQSLDPFAMRHTGVLFSMNEVLMSLSLFKSNPDQTIEVDHLTESKNLHEELPLTLVEIKQRSRFLLWEHFLERIHSISDELKQNYSEANALNELFSELKKQRRRILLLDENEERVNVYLKELQGLHDDSRRFLDTVSISVSSNDELFDQDRRDLFIQLGVLVDEIDKALNTGDPNTENGIQAIQKDWIKQIQADPLAFADVVKKYANVKGVTCQQAAAKRHGLFEVVYDAVIVDEAARANPLDLLIPLTMANKIILVGDHKQLPHILEHQFEILYKEQESEKAFEEIFQKSLFERLYSAFPPSKKAMLSKQFRMHPDIGNLVSELFYKGLEHGLENDSLLNDTGFYDGKNLAWLDVPYRSVRNPKGEQGKYQNQAEATIIIDEIKKLIKDNGHYTFGIITFYSQQATLLQSLVKNHGLTDFVEVGTVDAFQGKEKDMIFLSTVRSNSYQTVRQSLGFLQFPNRLNVAISRAKRLLVIVGDSSTLKKETNFRKLYQYTKEKGYVTTVH